MLPQLLNLNFAQQAWNHDEHGMGKNYGGPCWAVFNVWRPLLTVCWDPLAVAEATSVPESDRDILPRSSKGLPAKPEGFEWGSWPINPPKERAEQHHWYWLSDMNPDEILKIF